MSDNILLCPVFVLHTTGNFWSEKSAPQVQECGLPLLQSETWIPPAMLSFCAKPQRGVAESIIQRITLSLREGGRRRRWVRAREEHFPSPLIRPDGHLLPGEGFPPIFETVDSATSGMNALRAE